MKYKHVVAVRAGGPEVLQVMENDLRTPANNEVRIKVLASSVCRPDITARTGKALYSGTPLEQKYPFVPGYAVIGIIDAIGQNASEAAVGQCVGALTVVGSYSEYVYWRSDRLIPIPAELDPAQAVTLILNYIVAYQCMYRSVCVKKGDTVLIIGASGGIGTALMQLGQLAGLKMYGLASAAKHEVLRAHGVHPIDYHNQDFVSRMREAEPQGIQAVFDGMMRPQAIDGALSLLKCGGCVVSYGEPAGFADLFRVLRRMLTVNLLPNGKSLKLYGTSTYFIGDKKPFLEDWQTLFNLLQNGQINPVIAQKFPILEAAAANRLLEGGTVSGNLVLVNPILL